jgi:hypothetical protein
MIGLQTLSSLSAAEEYAPAQAFIPWLHHRRQPRLRPTSAPHFRQIVPTPFDYVFEQLHGIVNYLLRNYGVMTLMIMERFANGNPREDLSKIPRTDIAL